MQSFRKYLGSSSLVACKGIRHLIMQKRLYKYRPFNHDDLKSKKRTEDIFLKNELYFPSPSQFNDPFDCLVHLDFSKVKKEEFWQYFNKALLKRTELTEQQIREKFERVYKSDNKEKIFTASLQNSFNSRGVYSLSSKNDDILMWSHYSDGHRGYCFELDGIELKPQKVKYRKRYPKFDLFNGRNLLRILLFTKSSRWKYEREWRYFSEKSGPINIHNNSVKCVILGSQMDDKNRESLLAIIAKSKHNPDILEAVINKDGYSVSVKKYEI